MQPSAIQEHVPFGPALVEYSQRGQGNEFFRLLYLVQNFNRPTAATGSREPIGVVAAGPTV